MKTGIFCISLLQNEKAERSGEVHKTQKALTKSSHLQPKFKFQAVSSASRSSKLALRTFFLSTIFTH